MGSSELIFRGHETQQESDSYTPKPPKPWESLTRLLRYLLREQRLMFLLIGIALPTIIFTMLYSSNPLSSVASLRTLLTQTEPFHKIVYQGSGSFGGKIPLGLKSRGSRIVVTGGAGFVGSHLVDRLIKRGDSVIVVDNFFTGNKENVMHHFGNPNFEVSQTH
ncbi:hypothetical protein Leryth_005554 [Lithospermum erythrorhizon]|nr:hypothetical protein Leryth_005554 [Lithospermum erythrorhizon]